MVNTSSHLALLLSLYDGTIVTVHGPLEMIGRISVLALQDAQSIRYSIEKWVRPADGIGSGNVNDTRRPTYP